MFCFFQVLKQSESSNIGRLLNMKPCQIIVEPIKSKKSPQVKSRKLVLIVFLKIT